MKIKLILGAAALSLTLAACGENGTTPDEGRPAVANASNGGANPSVQASNAQTFSGTGDVTQITGESVTISHGPIEAKGWPAMTMAFRAGSSGMLQGVNVGDPVSFQFRDDGGSSVLTSISKR